MPTSATGNRHRAVTLVELLVVVAILGVLAGVIIPRMGSSVTRRQLDEAAGRLAHTARTVRELAVARQQRLALEVDLDAGAIAVAKPTAAGEHGAWQPLRMSWLKFEKLPKTVQITGFRTANGDSARSGTQYIEFYPDGAASGAALTLTSSAGTSRVIVHAHSGRVDYGDPRNTDFSNDQFDLGD
jgi:type II secretion system protein H